MNFIENIKIAVDSIMSNKMRSILTMLGIIIGISSVITIVSLGQGGKNAITGQFAKLGANTISITLNSSKATVGDFFNEKDISLIKENIDSVRYITPVVQKNGVATSEKTSKTAVINGGSPDMASVNAVELVSGRYFNEGEYSEGKSVIIIEEISAKALFGTTDVVGKSLTLGSKTSPQKVTIIGISKGFASAFVGGEGTNMPVFIDAPATLIEKLFPTDFEISKLSIVSYKKEDTETMGNSARNLIENRHNNKERDIYKVDSALKQMDQINKVLGIFTTFISAVAGISLLVGGIGVMNIMLVSVTERTREIGIRKAIGATTGVILFQFLTESVIISVLGGIIGLIFGVLGSELIGSFAGITPEISIQVIVLVILFSSAVGIFFGIYPARKAASLDPIEALRYE